MIYYKDKKWHICPYKAKYTTHGQPREKYTIDKKWWERFVSRWWHHENLRFEPVNPTDEQLARLDEINEAGIPQGFMADASAYVEYGHVQNKDSSHFSGFSDQQDAFDKFISEKAEEIEQERIKRTELMPYESPDSGRNVYIKLKEESPNKPRQTWLSGKANKADSRIRRNLDMDDVDGDKYLIAADDSRHEMTADDWLDLGEKIDSWITSHVFAASQHMQAVKDLDAVEDIIDYDYTKDYWPS